MATDISGLLDRIQEEISVEDITPDVVATFLAGHDYRGKTVNRRRIGTLIANTIQKEIKISQSITLTQSFAEERKIKLTENTKGGIYNNWGRYGKKAVVIFKSGKIKAWRYLK